MSIADFLSFDLIKVIELLFLGLFGYYFIFRDLTKKQQKKGIPSNEVGNKSKAIPGAGTPVSSNRGVQEKPTLEQLKAKYGASPEVFYDETEKCYVVADPHNQDELIPIALDDLKTLNGGVLPEGVEAESSTERQANEPIAGGIDDGAQNIQQNREVPVPRDGVIGIEDFEDFEEDHVDFELEQRNAQLADQQAIEFQQQEIAAGTGIDPTSRQNRTIGAKKAKSLKRKDQKKAYNEYLRQVSAARRADEEEHEQQYGDLIALEREERAKRNEEAEREQKARLQKQKEEEEKQKAAKEEMRQRLYDLKPGEYLRISDPEEVKIAHGLKDAFVVNNETYVIRFSESDIKKLADSIAKGGSVSFEEVAKTLTEIKAPK